MTVQIEARPSVAAAEPLLRRTVGQALVFAGFITLMDARWHHGPELPWCLAYIGWWTVFSLAMRCARA